ncbi:hypothetical protein [Nakamurella lactea]|uniref:hypothetical protein n=1 Tax=Nakamurella lactea TaxID=459515 RepID=UPI00048BE820|nr:hypothetical protein [Nakamurella lactea]
MTNPVTNPTVEEYERRAQSAEKSPTPVILKIARVVVWAAYVLVVINAILLTLAFLLRLFGANPDAGFVEWVYRSSAAALGPFDNMFRSHDVGEYSVLDTSLLFAIVFYLILGAAIHAVLNWLGNKLVQQQNEAKQARQAADAVKYDFARQQFAAQQQELARQQEAARRFEEQQRYAAQQQAAAAAAAAAEQAAYRAGHSDAQFSPPPGSSARQPSSGRLPSAPLPPSAQQPAPRPPEQD